jgi:predicted Rossmann fold flavoprotein
MNIYDVIVIGGGPAGLMAAGRAAELGAQVLLLEKNKQVGIKLLMTGGSRCNVTNNSPLRSLIADYGLSGPFLFSALSIFGSNDLINFFEKFGLVFKTEDRGRVFPQDNKASSILQALLEYNKKNKVEILTEANVEKILKQANQIDKIILKDGREFKARKYIIAAGGKSYPSSGSSGEVYDWLKFLGHNIIEPKPGLSRIIVLEDIDFLEGLSISQGKLSLLKNEKVIAKELGDFIFTARGLSGPAALSLSREITKHEPKSLRLVIDFLPEEKDLDNLILSLINQNKNLTIKNILAKIYPKRLIEFMVDFSDKKANGITKEERRIIIKQLKSYSLNLTGVGGFSEAMITVGGLDLKELDPKTMQSKLINNLYLVGELLNIDGPTGGYNLQVAWSTAYVAGTNIIK